MKSTSVHIKNLTDRVVHLKSADRDSVSIMPKASAWVDIKFLDWQPPSPKVISINHHSYKLAQEAKAKLHISRTVSAAPNVVENHVPLTDSVVAEEHAANVQTA
jgi:hypothetical protein